MSIIKKISQLPDTKQGFEINHNTLALISGIFISEKDVLFPSIDSFMDVEDWYDFLQSNDITPLHYVRKFDNLDKETQLIDSLQDFTYESNKGQYRHKLSYDWAVDYHQLVQQLNGTDYYIYYWDKNWNIYGTSDDGVSVRGFKTNRLILEKLLFQLDQTPAFSVLDIELSDSDELNLRGVVKQVTWNPEEVDRLFTTINIEFLNSNTLNFSATYNSQEIEVIGASDVTVTDDKNGAMSFSLFNYLGGVYQLSGFTALDPTKQNTLITGKLEIKSSLYIGCVRYIVTTIVIVTNNFVFEDGENFVFEDGNNFIFEN